MRQLGSFFHIAMNGMAASDKIFRLLDLPEAESKIERVPADCSIICSELHFSYDADREILHRIDMRFPKGSFTSIIGKSGCGKSTIAAILMGRNKGYTGSVTVGGTELSEINEVSLMQNFTYISHQSYLFKGTVRENLLIGKPNADDSELWTVLKWVKLDGFFKSKNGLDTPLSEKAGNLSGGQCQRLALARALLHDSPIYIFDEAISNIDVEGENDIIREIHSLAKIKTVILISHRQSTMRIADKVYSVEHGRIS